MQKWTRSEMAQRAARDISPGWYVNIGIGLPELICQYLRPTDEIVLHSENGILGMGPIAVGSDVDLDLVNAGKQPVTAVTGAAFFEHTTSFAMMRGGHIDACLLGALEVSETGDIANWWTGDPLSPPAVGGAMDLVVGAKRLYVLMEHCTKDGRPKIVRRCALPLTGKAAVDRIYTDLAVIDVTESGLHVVDRAPGVDNETLQRLTEAPLVFAGLMPSAV